MRQPRPEYPSDEARRKNKPAVRVHHSLRNHPRYASIAADPRSRGMLIGLWMIASERHASKTADTVTLNHGDVIWITGTDKVGPGVQALLQLCYRMGYEVARGGGTVAVTIRNFARKQGFDSAARGVGAETYSATPHPSESESESESEKKKKEATPLVVSATPKPTRQVAEVSPEEIVEAWKRLCVPKGAPDIREITGDRRKKMLLRIREHPNFDWWDELFARAARTPFLFGTGNRGWKASLDWLVDNQTNAVKILEGRYDNGPTRQEGPRQWGHAT